jgi:multiple sugar transport system permease protein
MPAGNMGALAAAPKKYRRLNTKRELTVASLVFMAPAVISLLIWFVYPFLQSIYISFFDYTYMHPDEWNFVGLGNYIEMFKDPDFYKALGHTLSFVAIVVPVQTVLALIIANAVNQKMRGRGFIRTAVYMPYVLSAVAVATVFMYFFVQGQGLAKFFSLFGLPDTTWFTHPKLALPFIGLLYIWQMLGFYMIYYLAGLQTIPESIYEAAQIDGASKTQIFFRITVPNLKHTTFLVVTYGMIQCFQLFDQISVVTKPNALGSPAGATSTLITMFYSAAFSGRYRMGYGSAIAIVLFVIILIVSLLQRKLTKMED